MVEIKRIAKSLENPRFIQRYFSEKEQAFFKQKGNATQSIAANFAAKEAFSKALGTGVRGFSLNEISVLRNESGAPFFSFSGEVKKIVDRHGLDFSVSLTHTNDTACAVVIAFALER